MYDHNVSNCSKASFFYIGFMLLLVKINIFNEEISKLNLLNASENLVSKLSVVC